MLKIICVLATIFGTETKIPAFQPQFLTIQPKLLFKSSLALEFLGSYLQKFEISLPAKNIFLRPCSEPLDNSLDHLPNAHCSYFPTVVICSLLLHDSPNKSGYYFRQAIRATTLLTHAPSVREKKILDRVSVYFNPSSFVGIMGPSGCGKTTFLDIVTGRREISSRQRSRVGSTY